MIYYFLVQLELSDFGTQSYKRLQLFLRKIHNNNQIYKEKN